MCLSNLKVRGDKPFKSKRKTAWKIVISRNAEDGEEEYFAPIKLARRYRKGENLAIRLKELTKEELYDDKVELGFHVFLRKKDAIRVLKRLQEQYAVWKKQRLWGNGRFKIVKLKVDKENHIADGEFSDKYGYFSAPSAVYTKITF